MTQQHTDRALTWSYGGGTQSIAIAVLVAQGKLPKPEVAVIADTSREASETWEYTDRWVRPMLREVGVEIQVAPHSLSNFDLYDGEDGGTPLIPAFTETGALSTFCSGKWKADVLSRHLRTLGYGPTHPVRTWIGISVDEISRMKPSRVKWQEYYHPLIWDVRMRREHCRALVESVGLPTPPKSSCWMCPFRRNSQWRHLRDNYPEDFERACQLDEEIRAKDEQGGVWLHESRVPLREADLSAREEPPMFKLFGGSGEVQGCDSGMCWT
jgi:hypothetical protein